MSLLDSDENLNYILTQNSINISDNISDNIGDTTEIDSIYESWQQTENEFLQLRRRNNIRNRMVTSLTKLNQDMKTIAECEGKFSKRNKYCNYSYFNGLKLIGIVSANLAVYYFIFS